MREGDATGTRQGELLEKFPLEPLKTFWKKVLSPPKGNIHRQRWREVTPTFADVGYRQDPAVSPPRFLGLQRCLGIKRTNTPHSHKITSVDLGHNIFSLHNLSIPTPCLNHKNKSHPVKSAQARTLGVSVP